MNILLVSQEFPPETALGGIGTQTYLKAKWLSEFGHNITVISTSKNFERQDLMDGKIRIIRLPGKYSTMHEMTHIVKWITRSVEVASEIDVLKRQIEFDIIDFPEWAAESFVYLLNRKGRIQIPTVIQLHGPLVMFAHEMGWPELDSEFYRLGTEMEATSIRLADAMYSSSLCSNEWIQKYYNPGKSEVPIIHTGVDTKLFLPNKELMDHRTTILFIGNIVPNKGVLELTEAVCNLSNDFPEIRLRLIGKGDDKILKKINSITEKYHKNDIVEYSGFIEKTDLPKEFSRAQIFAAPSYYEGGPGFVYLEAMSCGLPVIGCSGSGIDEIIENDINGILVKPKVVTAIQDALRRLLSDKDFMIRISKNAREYVVKEADTETNMRKLESFYQKVIEKKSCIEENVAI